ncbi:MAG: nucleoside triphosphate pyrophosphohydrolase [Fimbriimonadaceae bacterium]
MTALEKLGLSGAFQVHVAPVVLRPDLRAHQVFVGFTDPTAIARLFPNANAWLVNDAVTAVALSTDLNINGDLVIAASETDSPGGLYGLVWVVDRLLGPGGCPWDQEQTHESLKRHLIEEAYELAQAIDVKDDDKMKEELGDVLLQPLMHAQMRALAGSWDIDDVARAVTEKLVRRHPHVFDSPLPSGGEGPGVRGITSEQVLKNWDEIKKKEKGGEDSVLAGVPKAMPALLRAFEVSKRASRCGFEWPDVAAVWDKLHEEERELKEATTEEQKKSEVGDLLFTVVNLARWSGVEPEDALRQMLDRFTRRFQAMERAATKPLRELNPIEWDDLWEAAKSDARINKQ